MLPIRAAAVRTARSTFRSAVPATRRMNSTFGDADFGANGAPRLLSPWNKWFPYEPVPCSPQLAPYQVKVVGQTDYWFCTCGECANQPFADEGTGCKKNGFTPIHYFPRYSGTKFFCGCKKCSTMPMTNGTCYLVWIDYNMTAAVPLFFGASFVFGLISTYWFHP
eukprot:gnl/TRDRNA2_/TRDRNA2_163836_c0_seq1.p1 gnl/TRDRNA2_/TRDRNA2_163836_c0~~gnl/TRDRNA2_/TRDRNA2_163836_c0_seq1.p1  ORF type:complete len:165 (+),score=16.48 gnl/TRDRNA2_/TRDRNA2_163836_c0_seq1:114-608(+)